MTAQFDLFAAPTCADCAWRRAKMERQEREEGPGMLVDGCGYACREGHYWEWDGSEWRSEDETGREDALSAGSPIRG